MFLNSSKTKDEEKQAFFKKYIPFCIAVAVGFVVLNVFIAPYLIGILK